MKLISKSITSRIAILSIFATLCMVTLILWLGFEIRSMYVEKAQNDIRQNMKVVKDSHDGMIAAISKALEMGLNMLATNQAVSVALVNGDRELLRTQLQDVYDKGLKSQFGWRFFQFHTPDNQSFYRFDQSEESDEDLVSSNPIVIKTNETRQLQQGLEIGKNGINYCVAIPLLEQGGHVGSAELSQDYLEFLQTLSSTRSVNVALSVQTHLLEKAGYKYQGDELKVGSESFLLLQGDRVRKALETIDPETLTEEGTFTKAGESDVIVTRHVIHGFLGEEIGHLVFLKPIESPSAQINSVLVKGVLALLIAGFILGLIYVQQLITVIFRPLKKIASYSSKLESGDLSQDLDYEASNEIGKIAVSLHQLSLNLGVLLHQISLNSKDVKTSSDSMTHVSTSLFDSAKAMNQKSSEIASRNEELALSLRDVSEKAEEGSSNINMVATAGEEMSATIAEIAENSEQTRMTMVSAVQKVVSANDRVKELESAAEEISQVIWVIVEIAEQTKLLALNATIEAARAGEAGKGFAVVAKEVKDLAAQTNSATEEIRAKIQAIQDSTRTTIQEFSLIKEVMTQANDMVSNIAAAVEEQAVTTRDMAENISMAAERINEVNVTSTQSFEVASQISREVFEIDQASNEVYSNSSAIRANADELNQLGSELSSSVSQFKISKSAQKQAETLVSHVFMKWDASKYSVEIESIDSQHKILVRIINDLHEAMKSQATQDRINRIFNELVEYTTFHFEEEQKMMSMADYPDLPNHIDVHKALVTQVMAYRKQVLDGNQNVANELMDFLKNWLLNHIVAQDKKYTPYMKKKGLN